VPTNYTSQAELQAAFDADTLTLWTDEITGDTLTVSGKTKAVWGANPITGAPFALKSVPADFIPHPVYAEIEADIAALEGSFSSLGIEQIDGLQAALDAEIPQSQVIGLEDDLASILPSTMFVFENMELAGETDIDKLNAAITAVSSQGGGLLYVSTSIDIPKTQTLSINSSHSNVWIKALTPTVELRLIGTRSTEAAVGDERTRGIFFSGGTNNTLDGFAIIANGLASSSLCELGGTDNRIINCTLRSIDPVELYSERVAAYPTVTAEQTVAEAAMIFMRAGNTNCVVLNNKFQDCFIGVTSTTAGTGLKIFKNRFSNYSGRGIYIRASAGSETNHSKIIDNEWLAPSTLANTALGVIKQPFAMQQTGEYSASKTRYGIFWGNTHTKTLTPYEQDNPADSPGEGSNVASDSVADVFSFHAAYGWVIQSPSVKGGGEIGFCYVGKGSHNNYIIGGRVEDGDTASVAIGTTADGIDPDLRNQNNTVSGVVCYNAANDLAHDHGLVAPIQASGCDGIHIVNNSVHSNGAVPPFYSASATYAVDDLVVNNVLSTAENACHVYKSLADSNLGNALNDETKWQIQDKKALGHCIEFADCTGIHCHSNSLTKHTVYEQIFFDDDCVFERLEIDHVSVQKLPAFVTRNMGNPLYVTETSQYEYPDGSGGWDIYGEKLTHSFAHFMSTGVIVTGSARRNITNNASLSGNVYTVTTTVAFRDTARVTLTMDDPSLRKATFVIIDASTIEVSTTTLGGAATTAAFRIDIRD